MVIVLLLVSSLNYVVILISYSTEYNLMNSSEFSVFHSLFSR